MNWLLLIVIVVIVWNTYRGMKVGLVKTAFSMMSIIIAIILSTLISPIVNQGLAHNEVIYNKVSEGVDKMIPSMEDGTKKKEGAIIEALPIPKTFKEALDKNNTKETYKAMAIENFREYINVYLSNIIIRVISFVLVFIIVAVVLFIVSNSLDLISKLPILKTINTAGGFGIGMAKGFVLVWILFILLMAFSGSELGKMAMEMVESSPVLEIIYENNLLLGFVFKIIK